MSEHGVERLVVIGEAGQWHRPLGLFTQSTPSGCLHISGR